MYKVLVTLAVAQICFGQQGPTRLYFDAKHEKNPELLPWSKGASPKQTGALDDKPPDEGAAGGDKKERSATPEPPKSGSDVAGKAPLPKTPPSGSAEERNSPKFSVKIDEVASRGRNSECQEEGSQYVIHFNAYDRPSRSARSCCRCGGNRPQYVVSFNANGGEPQSCFPPLSAPEEPALPERPVIPPEALSNSNEEVVPPVIQEPLLKEYPIRCSPNSCYIEKCVTCNKPKSSMCISPCCYHIPTIDCCTTKSPRYLPPLRPDLWYKAKICHSKKYSRKGDPQSCYPAYSCSCSLARDACCKASPNTCPFLSPVPRCLQPRTWSTTKCSSGYPGYQVHPAPCSGRPFCCEPPQCRRKKGPERYERDGYFCGPRTFAGGAFSSERVVPRRRTHRFDPWRPSCYKRSPCSYEKCGAPNGPRSEYNPKWCGWGQVVEDPSCCPLRPLCGCQPRSSKLPWYSPHNWFNHALAPPIPLYRNYPSVAPEVIPLSAIRTPPSSFYDTNITPSSCQVLPCRTYPPM